MHNEPKRKSRQPTHDDHGEAYDPQNAGKGVMQWGIVSLALVALSFFSYYGWI